MPGRKRASTERKQPEQERGGRASVGRVVRSGRSQKETGTSRRGFAAMDEKRQKAIASMGGRAAHRSGTAHQWSPEEARRAGKKGGRAAHERGTAHQWDEEEARRAGKKGGRVAHARGTAHEWTEKEARAAGRKGGRARWSEGDARAQKSSSRSRSPARKK
jgi:uncharacterized protein